MMKEIKEITYRAKQYVVIGMCPKCENGELEFSGYSNPTCPPQYHHKCKECGHKEVVTGKQYPQRVYRRGRVVDE